MAPSRKRKFFVIAAAVGFLWLATAFFGVPHIRDLERAQAPSAALARQTSKALFSCRAFPCLPLVVMALTDWSAGPDTGSGEGRCYLWYPGGSFILFAWRRYVV